MSKWTRRDLVKTGVTAAAGVFAGAAAAPGETRNEVMSQIGSETGPNSVTLAPVIETVAADALRQRILMDFGWRFHLGHACDPEKDFGFGKLAREATYAKSGATAPAAGATDPATDSKTGAAFDDSAWTEVDLPHDWAVDLPFALDSSLAATLVEHGGKPLGREFPETSIGWYRRRFDVPATDLGKRIRVDFDGVFRDAAVFVNGHSIGENFSGYAPFSFDITDFLDYGKTNLLAVRVDATLGEGWFYEGAGIYRHVWLTTTAPVHIARWGTFVLSELVPVATKLSAKLTIATELENDSDKPVLCRLRHTILNESDASGQPLATVVSAPCRIAPGSGATLTTQTHLADPQLWSIESAQPHLYRVVSVLEVDGRAIDQDSASFGIRTIQFDAQKGFLLNGKQVKIKGTCNHQDHAGLGSALPDALHTYRLNILKEMGSNACRTSHNPAAPEFLDACDRLGFLVMEETRIFSSSPEGLSELERMVRRDRNHPSIVIWSLANEEPQQGTPRGAHIIATMKKLAKRLDPTRPVTAAMNGEWGKGFSDVVDVQGYNYGEWNIDDFRKAHPDVPMIGTETASTLSTRGVYRKDAARGYVTAYDGNVPEWGMSAEKWWKFYAARVWLAGGFVWTGFDYRGEPTPYKLPCISSHFGLVDTCGFPKDNYFYYKAWWAAAPALHLFPHWNWAGQEGQPIDVWCYTNQDSVELLLNGQSLGSKPVERNGHLAWSVRFAPGRLEARAMKSGQPSLTAVRQTTGAARKLQLTADRAELHADGRDAAVVRVALLDDAGLEVPTADNVVHFSVSGPGRLIGVGNGDPSCHESDKAPRRSAFNGLCMAIVQTRAEAGTVTLTATSPGIEEASIHLIAK